MKHFIQPDEPIMAQLRRIGLPEHLPVGVAMVYRFLDTQGRLLYVGVTVSPRGRWQGHKNASSWWPYVRHVLVEWHPHERSALDAEVVAIRTESPRHNVRSAPAVLTRGSCAPHTLLMSHFPLSRSRRGSRRGRRKNVTRHPSVTGRRVRTPRGSSVPRRWMGQSRV